MTEEFLENKFHDLDELIQKMELNYERVDHAKYLSICEEIDELYEEEVLEKED